MDLRVLLDGTAGDVAGIVHHDVDAAVDRDRLLRDRLQVVQRRRHVELEGGRAGRLKVVELRQRSGAGGRDDLVAAREGREGEDATETRTARWTSG
jgi:hypothetical protein